MKVVEFLKAMKVVEGDKIWCAHAEAQRVLKSNWDTDVIDWVKIGPIGVFSFRLHFGTGNLAMFKVNADNYGYPVLRLNKFAEYNKRKEELLEIIKSKAGTHESTAEFEREAVLKMVK